MKKKIKICCVFNYPPLYRFSIYDAMSKEFECDFYFGDNVFQPLNKFDPNDLKGFKGYLHAKQTRIGYIWHSGIFHTLKLKYTHYVITGSHVYLAYWIIYLFAKLTGKKVLMWTHGMKKPVSTINSSSIVKLFYKLSDYLLMYNHYSCPFTAELGFDINNMYVIHNSLNTSQQTTIFNSITPSNIYHQHFGNLNPNIIFIGRLQKRMKLDQIIKAVSILKEKGTSINITFVGPITDDYELKDLCVEKGLSDNIWFYGPSYDEKENSVLIYNADVCVVPGSIGLTAIHALSYGTPVITNDNFSTQMPEFEAIRDGVTGAFFKEDDIDDLADKISNWISLPLDERERVRKCARSEVESSWSVDYQISILKKVLSL